MRIAALAVLVLAGCLSQPPRPSCQSPNRLDELANRGNTYNPWLSRDRLELLYATDENGNYEIFRSTRSSAGDTFSPGTSIVAMPGTYVFDPTMSEDENTLWFVGGNSQVGGTIYEAHRDHGFQDVRPVFDELGPVLHPSFRDHAREVFFAKSQADNPSLHDIYVATRSSTTSTFSVPDSPLPFRTGLDEGGPSISPDGEVLTFQTDGIGTLDGTHIVRAYRSDGFSTMQLVEEVQPVDFGHDGMGMVHPDGRTIVFSSDRTGPIELWITCE